MRRSASPATPVVLGERGEEVDAAVTVDLDVDQPRNRDQSMRPATQADIDNAPVLDRDVAWDELPVDERGLDPEPHVDAARRSDPRVLVRASLTAPHTSAPSGVARCVMYRHASYPQVQRSSTPSSRAAAIAASSSGTSAR